MTPKIDPLISTIIVILAVILTLVGFTAQRLALRRLRIRYPERWAALLQPGDPADRPSGKQIALFMKSSNAARLNDPVISMCILIARCAMFAVGALFLGGIALSVIYAH